VIRQDFAKAFEKVDAVISPTSPVPAFNLGESTADPLQMYLADIFTIAANPWLESVESVCRAVRRGGWASPADRVAVVRQTAG